MRRPRPELRGERMRQLELSDMDPSQWEQPISPRDPFTPSPLAVPVSPVARGILDGILEAYIEEGLGIDAIAKKGFSRGLVKEIVRKVDLNEYKRQQAAPGIRVTSKAFGPGRRFPIVQRFQP